MTLQRQQRIVVSEVKYMGTDIHSIAQVKRDGRWTTVAIGIDGDQRNYNTFAMLANVRNATVVHRPSRLTCAML